MKSKSESDSDAGFGCSMILYVIVAMTTAFHLSSGGVVFWQSILMGIAWPYALGEMLSKFILETL